MKLLTSVLSTSKVARSLVTNNLFKGNAVRALSTSVARKDASDIRSLGAEGNYKPTNFDKKILVYFKYYENEGAIPNLVRSDKMDKAKSQMRILVSIIMMGLTLGACLFTVYIGKTNMHKRSLIDQNERRHRAYKEDSNISTPRLKLFTGDGEEKKE